MRPRPIHPDALAANTHASSTNGSGIRIGQTIDARLDLRVRPTRPLPIGQTEHAATDHARIEPTYTLDEYLNAVREIEQRIVAAAKPVDLKAAKAFPAPQGIPGDNGEHIRLMGDLMALAFQTDLTRVSTFVVANGDEFEGLFESDGGQGDA
jgi:hypothetical protein